MDSVSEMVVKICPETDVKSVGYRLTTLGEKGCLFTDFCTEISGFIFYDLMYRFN